MAIAPNDLSVLEERVRAAAGLTVRRSDERIELVPATLREAGRALAVKALFSNEAAPLEVSREAFDAVELPDPISGTVRVGATANVGEVEASLRGWGLTLGWPSPGACALTVAQWLEGPYAGLRPATGGRVESAALSLEIALRGGGYYVGPAAPRAAAGPALDGIFLGAGGQAGLLVGATLRGLPRAEVGDTVRASVDRPEQVVTLLRRALEREVPIIEVQVKRKSRGFRIDLLFASHAFRAGRDRVVMEELVKESGELRTMHQVEDLALDFEGELGWDRLAWAVAQSGPIALYRLARQSLVIAAEAPVKGAVPLDRAAEPLPPAFLAAVEGLAGSSGAKPTPEEAA